MTGTPRSAPATRIGRESLETATAVFVSFAANASRALSSLLRTEVELELRRTAAATWDIFEGGWLSSNGTLRWLAGSPPAPIFAQPGPFAFVVLERLLGGGEDAEPAVPNRAPTTLERSLLQPTVDQLGTALGAALSCRESIECSGGAWVGQSDPDTLPVSTSVIMTHLNWRLAARTGVMAFCLPAGPVGAIIRQAWDPTLSVELRGIVARTELSRAQVAALEPGDIITTSTPPEVDARLEVEGVTLFQGSLGAFRGCKAIRLGMPRDT